jgi:hypothetical protein
MNPSNKWLKITGLVLNILVAALMLFAASGKLFGFAPPEVKEHMGDKLLLIGIGEMTAAVLLLVPRTSPLGTLMTSGFWGGVICYHMFREESFAAASVFLTVTWLGAYLRGSVPLLAVAGADSRSARAERSSAPTFGAGVPSPS